MPQENFAENDRHNKCLGCQLDSNRYVANSNLLWGKTLSECCTVVVESFFVPHCKFAKVFCSSYQCNYASDQHNQSNSNRLSSTRIYNRKTGQLLNIGEIILLYISIFLENEFRLKVWIVHWMRSWYMQQWK